MKANIRQLTAGFDGKTNGDDSDEAIESTMTTCGQGSCN
jgi:hypothetical protein